MSTPTNNNSNFGSPPFKTNVSHAPQSAPNVNHHAISGNYVPSSNTWGKVSSSQNNSSAPVYEAPPVERDSIAFEKKDEETCISEKISNAYSISEKIRQGKITVTLGRFLFYLVFKKEMSDINSSKIEELMEELFPEEMWNTAEK